MISYSNIKIFSKLAEAACPDAFVKGFSNPLLALKWLEEREASLIIADDKMPGMTGAELTRQVRHLPLCAEGPVIVVTAYHDQNFRVEVLEAGATDFLLSPIDFSEFQPRIRNLLKLNSRQIIACERARLLEQELLQTRHLRDQALRESHAQLSQVIDTIPMRISTLISTVTVFSVMPIKRSLSNRHGVAASMDEIMWSSAPMKRWPVTRGRSPIRTGSSEPSWKRVD